MSSYILNTPLHSAIPLRQISLTRARSRRWPFTICLKHAPLFWRFRFIIYLKHAPSFGDSGTPYSLVCRCNARSTARLIDGSVGRRTDWLTDSPLPLDDRLTDWLTDSPLPADRLTDWPLGWLTDWLTDWLTAPLALRLTDRSVGCQPTDWLAASLTDWLASAERDPAYRGPPHIGPEVFSRNFVRSLVAIELFNPEGPDMLPLWN